MSKDGDFLIVMKIALHLKIELVGTWCEKFSPIFNPGQKIKIN